MSAKSGNFLIVLLPRIHPQTRGSVGQAPVGGGRCKAYAITPRMAAKLLSRHSTPSKSKYLAIHSPASRKVEASRAVSLLLRRRFAPKTSLGCLLRRARCGFTKHHVSFRCWNPPGWNTAIPTAGWVLLASVAAGTHRQRHSPSGPRERGSHSREPSVGNARVTTRRRRHRSG